MNTLSWTNRLDRLIAVGLVWACAEASSWVHADVFVLRSGARVRGEWLNSGESPIRRYLVQLSPDVRVTLSPHQVAEHLLESPDLAHYDRWAPTLPDTVTDHWQVAEWCRERGLKTQQQQHLWRVIELEPDHAAARRALGFSEIDGKWTTTQQYFLERGFVFYQGKWRLPQEVDLIEERRRIERMERDWIARLKLWRSQLGTERDEEARKNLLAINDPAALKGLTDALRRERYPRVRELLVQSIAKLRTSGALEVLLYTALNDADPEVFHTSVDQLVAFQAPGLSRRLTELLKDPNNRRVNRAAHILGRLGDRQAIPVLVAALVTTHEVAIPPSRGTTAALVQPMTAAPGSGNLTPSGDPGTAFTVGRQPQTIRYPVANQEVLAALVKLSGGQSFGFEQQAWLNWWNSASRAGQLQP